MSTTSKFQDQTFLFTGTLTEFTREEAEALVTAHGGKVLSGLSGKLNYLVVGEDAGSKLEKAKALGTVKILTEKEFLKMVPKAKTTIAGKEPAKKLATTASGKSAIKASSDDTGSSNANTSDEVKIGNQIWMAKNLDVTHFRNGDPIPEVKTDEEWANSFLGAKPAWCYYGNDPANNEKYGKLYNWYALNDPRGIAPEGWHVSTGDEWDSLCETFGGPKKVCHDIMSVEGWSKKVKINNSLGFGGVPSGIRFSDGSFDDLGKQANWWVTDSYSTGFAYYRYIDSKNQKLTNEYTDKEAGMAIRCLKD